MSIAVQDKGVVLPEYTMDHLGTSFKVILVNSVRETTDAITGEKGYSVPDEQGLHKAIAQCRVLDARKLPGADIRFLRKTLGLKSKELAEKLDISAEHLSRCEAGDKVLASSSEKMLRLMVLWEPFYILEKASESAPENSRRTVEKLRSGMAQLGQVIHDMKIVPASLIDDELVYELVHQRRSAVVKGVEHSAANDDEHEWGPPLLVCSG